MRICCKLAKLWRLTLQRSMLTSESMSESFVTNSPLAPTSLSPFKTNTRKTKTQSVQARTGRTSNRDENTSQRMKTQSCTNSHRESQLTPRVLSSQTTTWNSSKSNRSSRQASRQQVQRFSSRIYLSEADQTSNPSSGSARSVQPSRTGKTKKESRLSSRKKKSVMFKDMRRRKRRGKKTKKQLKSQTLLRKIKMKKCLKMSSKRRLIPWVSS